MALLKQFKLKRIDLAAPYLWIWVRLFDTEKEVEATQTKFKDEGTLGIFNVAVLSPSTHHGYFGEIRLKQSRIIEQYVMHESIHVAFALSRYQYKWPAVDERDREEYIARTAEYIYAEIRKQLRNFSSETVAIQRSRE